MLKLYNLFENLFLENVFKIVVLSCAYLNHKNKKKGKKEEEEGFHLSP